MNQDHAQHLAKTYGNCPNIVEYDVYLSNGWNKIFATPCGWYGDGIIRTCATHA